MFRFRQPTIQIYFYSDKEYVYDDDDQDEIFYSRYRLHEQTNKQPPLDR